MQIRIFRPVTCDCRAEGLLLRPGKRLVHLESRLYDQGDRLVAYGAASCNRLDAG